jgi:transcriptional regulator with XRE-family HTH domain
MTARERRLRVAVARRLRCLRQDARLTIAQLAQRAGIYRSYVQKVETAQHDVTLLVLVRWTHALGSSVREFAQEIPALDGFPRQRRNPAITALLAAQGIVGQTQKRRPR